jgi:hypothetical protein
LAIEVRSRNGKLNYKHGHKQNKGSKTYAAWRAMKARCNNIKNKHYKNYGAIGITVCKRWSDKKNGFKNFLKDVGEIPKELTLDRIDNNGNYSPDNYKLSSRTQLQRNQRNNRNYIFNGKEKCVSELAEENNISKEALKYRLDNGYTIEEALTTPLRENKGYIKHMNKKIIIELCQHHGEAEFRNRGNNKYRCKKCEREDRKRFEKTPLGSYRRKLRNALMGCRRKGYKKISFSKDLPYNSHQLCEYLENIRKSQDNCCPMCHISYDINPFDVDHIIPTSTAKTREELLKLFNLENLSPLCYKCNRWIKRDRIIIYANK